MILCKNTGPFLLCAPLHSCCNHLLPCVLGSESLYLHLWSLLPSNQRGTSLGNQRAWRELDQSVRFLLLFSHSVVSNTLWPPWTAACQASLSTIAQSLLRLMFIGSVMPSNHLIFCHPLLLPSVLPSIRVFSNESALAGAQTHLVCQNGTVIVIPQMLQVLVTDNLYFSCNGEGLWASQVVQW